MPNNNKNKSKGGRPLKDINKKKNKIIAVCFTKKEHTSIKVKAQKVKLSLSVYCRDAILKAKILEPVKQEEMQLFRILAGMSHNLNQLVKLAHTYNMKVIRIDAQRLFYQMQSVLNKLSDDWKSYKR